ncbi:sensor histidine kinase [Anaerocolumna xylanovorans]|uniref:Sensor histidine kinase YesM n=1 Tax=Anaerocolumna xylanovorans DSM 12503 TaxID=1121345 RepID=A0A1M7Y6P4_9FIRM|nr:sensor histidine kinase [Anaerocolumna xylanovorans]SHO48313.1 Sensor histidine kinase YesM [Anaerocolumna xylanovorans DSM 12503]
MKTIKRMILSLYQDTPIVRKFMLSSFVLSLIPLILMSVLFYSRFRQIMRNEVASSYELVASQYVSNLENKINIYNSLIDSIVVNGTVQNVFSKQDKYSVKDTIDIWRLFYREIDNLIYAKNPQEIYSIMLYAKSDKFPRDGMHLSNYEQVADEQWFVETFRQRKPIYDYQYTVDALNIDLLSFVKFIPNLNGNTYTKELGLIKIDLLAHEFFGVSQKNAAMEAYDLFVLNPESEIIYTNSDQVFPEEELTDMINPSRGQSGHIILSPEYSNRIAVVDNINGCNWKVCLIFQNNKLDQKFNDTYVFIFMILLIMLAFMILLTFLFTTAYSRRTNQLIKKIKKIGKGDLSVKDVIYGNDEIGMIDAAFNHMIISLNEQIDKNYIQWIAMQEAELKALQLQINPHFLYNTLESISGMASIKGCPDISKVSEKLGMMFRYSINKSGTELVALNEEIQHVMNYFYIQNVRFGDTITPVIEIPDDLKRSKIPRFILQPIVENSIIHGFEGNKRQGCIEISATSAEDNLIIDIYDDGVGMSEKQVDDLNEYISQIKTVLHEEENRSIGVKNVNTRIRLMFGEQYGLQIRSKLSAGTQVRIILPLNSRMEGKNVQSIGC